MKRDHLAVAERGREMCPSFEWQAQAASITKAKENCHWHLATPKKLTTFLQALLGYSETIMNIFRILGDVSHLLAMIILLVKIWRSKSCAGKFLFFFSVLLTRHWCENSTERKEGRRQGYEWTCLPGHKTGVQMTQDLGFSLIGSQLSQPTSKGVLILCQPGSKTYLN